jgi:hypothetical protein
LTLTHIFIWGNHFEEPACIAVKSCLDKKRLEPDNTDVRPYIVDNKTYLCEITNGIDQFYYWQPTYGQNVKVEDLN